MLLSRGLILLVAAAIPLMASPCIGVEAPRDFRKTTWGMSEAQIVAAEGKKPVQRHEDGGITVLGYTDTIVNLECHVVYILARNQLTRAKYTITEAHSNKTAYLNDRDKLHKAIVDKYGAPKSDDTYWKNDLYKSDPSEWGMALAVGHLVKYARWDLPRTTIILYAGGDNFDVDVGVEYSSNDLEALEDEVKAAEANSKF